jgi:hypothetical protein
MIRLQKHLIVYAIDNPAMKIAAMHHSYESFERSELVMKLKGDLDQLKK